MTTSKILKWTKWFYNISHLEVDQDDGSKNVATVSRFDDGSCTLWMYNTRDKNLWTSNPTVYYTTTAEAVKAAENRFGVKSELPEWVDKHNDK